MFFSGVKRQFPPQKKLKLVFRARKLFFIFARNMRRNFLSDIPPIFLFPEKDGKEIGKIHVAFFKLHVSDDDDGVEKRKK